MTCWRRLRDWQAAGIWARLHRALLEHLDDAGALDWSRAAQGSASVPAKKKGGEETGPNPTDCGKPGIKRHIVVDGAGTPLGVTLSGANRYDSRMRAPTLDAVPGVHHGRGRPTRRPIKLHADKAYGHRRCRAECRARSVKPRIARRGVERNDRFGRHRWVVERTPARLNRFRRLTVRYERRADIHLAFVTLSCALTCLNKIKRFYQTLSIVLIVSTSA